MAALSYLDASAIVKLAVREPETDALEARLAGREALFSSRLGGTEAVRAARRSGSRDALARVAEALDALFLMEATADILAQAGMLEPPGIRTGDAIHLATALTIRDPELEFITYDDRQAAAARALGLYVSQPGYQGRPGPRPVEKRPRTTDG